MSGIKLSIIKEGDKVLVKRDKSKKMSDTFYNPTSSIEFDKKESMVTAGAQEATQVTRNFSLFKTLPIADE